MTSKAPALSLARISDYMELTKPRLVSLTLWSTAAGFILAEYGAVDFYLLFLTLLGAALSAAGSMSLNEWLEREEDGKMTRTASRPLPSNRLQLKEALIFGILLTVLGTAVLYFCVNLLAAFFALLTVISYVGIYTPLKKKTPFCTHVGAVPGALPPLIGWAAAAGNLSSQAGALFAIILFWQMPHFYAISWFLRKDYEAAGFRMLSVEDPSGRKVSRGIFAYNLIMIPVSFLPTLTGLTGALYFYAALFMGAALLLLSVLCLKDLNRYARLFFRSSLLYLTFLFIFMVIDKR